MSRSELLILALGVICLFLGVWGAVYTLSNIGRDSVETVRPAPPHMAPPYRLIRCPKGQPILTWPDGDKIDGDDAWCLYRLNASGTWDRARTAPHGQMEEGLPVLIWSDERNAWVKP